MNRRADEQKIAQQTEVVGISLEQGVTVTVHSGVCAAAVCMSKSLWQQTECLTACSQHTCSTSLTPRERTEDGKGQQLRHHLTSPKCPRSTGACSVRLPSPWPLPCSHSTSASHPPQQRAAGLLFT